MSKHIKNFILLLATFLSIINTSNSEIIKDIIVDGNQRISKPTIILFSQVAINDNIETNDLNTIIRNLYETNFFKDISVTFNKNILKIKIEEEPLIENVKFIGVKADKILDPIRKTLSLKNRSSYKESTFFDDQNKIKDMLRSMGYYFSDLTSSLEDLGDNKVNIIYNIKLGEKAKISKISFTGNKIFKEKKLISLIASEEYKFWKFVTGKKYLNEELVSLDTRLLRNFYLNKGYYKVEINSTFAKLTSNDEFELIFNIDAKDKYFFNDLKLKISDDYNDENFDKIYKSFEKLKNKPYSLNSIDNILNLIDEIVISEQFESINAEVDENIVDNNKINLTFDVKETEKFFVERINIYGNNVTEEKVIRNQLIIDEGDPYNEILKTKSINNIKNLNFFKSVKSEILDSNLGNNKILNIEVEEKATGEITAGAGFGTDGGTIAFGVKENNFLGKGISIDSSIRLSEEDIKGGIVVSNPNFKNTDKSVYFSLQTSETDRMKKSGYKTNKSGFSFGTEFEFFDDVNFGLGTSNFYEKISTDSTASARQQQQKGHYWDSFLNLSFSQDKRNQKFQTSKGYLSRYEIDIPIISDTNSFINQFNYKYYTELYNENVSSLGFTIGSAFSLDDNDIKLSERLFIPSSKLRGFEGGKVGPKDGNDFIGGNYLTTLNASTTLPQVLPNSQNTDFLMFFDAANIWGVDYDSTLGQNNKIRSSVGIGLDFFTPIGPLNFTLAQPITKDTDDIVQEFRFNLGTTF
ncbi:outer membrane protein assembly factor BamA [Candidatus Pelagibacter sp. HIMB1493]|uniref:outer membrane protein assembly factor BamA n=1 Tax=Candidatus Pelagibacter sp. HIMB1493 TaxID=3413334 RepID=UPI003F82C8D4